MGEKNVKRNKNIFFLIGNLKIEKRPKNEREKRPTNEGPARGVRLHYLLPSPVPVQDAQVQI